MADSTALYINDEEKVKACNELENARQIFPDVNIDVVESAIHFTGEVYEHILKCKQYFEVKVGRQRTCTRKSKVTQMYDENDIYCTLRRHDYSKYVTYEKINVVVVKANLLNFDGKIDCFVNTTNNKLEHHSQVSKLLKEAGGESYEMACEQVRQEASILRTTQCVVTSAGGMSTEHIIHAMCPVQGDYIFSKRNIENDVFSTVFNCLKMAEEHHFQTIAFSFLSTGHGQLDIKLCSQQYAYAILEFSRLRKDLFVVDTIYFVDKDKSKVDSVNEVFVQILPKNELQLLEVPRHDYSYYSVSRVQASAKEIAENLEQHLQIEDVSTGVSDAVDGQRALEQRKHAVVEDDDSIEMEHAYFVLEKEDNSDGSMGDSLNVSENDGYEIPVNIRNSVGAPEIHTDAENAEYVQNEHISINERIPEFRRKIGQKELVIERRDIRNSETIAIVCPENDGQERGGLLAVSIKCRFRQSFDPNKLTKLQKNAIATTEYTTENGGTRYILHVMSPVWKIGANEKVFEKGLKAATEMIFDKLKRHKKRNMRSIAIPLLGIDSVENDDIVGKCCEWQIQKIVEILQRKEEIANLQEVHLINRCEKIKNTLITELETFLPREM